MPDRLRQTARTILVVLVIEQILQPCFRVNQQRATKYMYDILCVMCTATHHKIDTTNYMHNVLVLCVLRRITK